MAQPTLSELLAKIRAERGTPTPARPVPQQPLSNPGIKFKAGAGNPQDPISWLLDIASRPLYSVTNRVNAINQSFTPEKVRDIQRASQQGDTGSLMSQFFGALGHTIGAPARGFFGTDESDHKYVSELMEETADTIGEARNVTDPNAPRYVNTEDNVNPVAKGVAGFAGDVLLDPLTYIPGAAIAGGVGKIAKLLGKTKPAPVEAPDAFAELIRTTPKAKAIEAPAKVPEHPGFVPELSAAPPALDGLVDGSTAVQRVLGSPKPQTSFYGRQAASESVIPPAPSAAVLADPKIQQAQEFISSLSKADAAELAVDASREAAKVGQKGNMLSKGEFLKQYADELGENASWRAADGTVVGIGAIANNPRKYFPMVPAARVAFEKAYKQYQRGWAKSDSPVDIYGDPLDITIPRQLPDVERTPFGRFQRAVAQEETLADAERLLGPHLFSYLRRATRSDTFERALAQINDVLQRGRSLDRITTTSRASMALRAVLGTTGVDVLGANLARRNIPRMQGAQTAARLGVKERAEVRKALLESPVGKVLNRAELAERNRVAKIAIESRRAAQVAQTVKKERIAEQVAQRERIMRFLPQVVKDHFEHGFKYRSDKGIARSHEAQGVGWGINDKLLNGYFQWNMAQRALDHWIAQGKIARPGPRGGKPSTMSGPDLARYLDENFTEDMRVIEDMLQGEGYQLWIGTTSRNAVPLSYTQMLEALRDANPDVIKFFYNVPTRVPFTVLQDAIIAAVRPGSRANPAEIERILAGDLKAVRPGTIDNPLAAAKGERFNYGFVPKRTKEPFDEWLTKLKQNAPEEGFKYVPNAKRTGVYRTFSPKALRKELTETIVKASDSLYETVSDNALALGKRYEDEAFDLTKEEVDALVALVDDPARMGSAIDAVAHYSDDLEALGEMGGATVDAVTMAKARVGDALDKPNLAYSLGASRAAEAAARVAEQGDGARVVATRRHTQTALDDAEAEEMIELGAQRRVMLDPSYDASLAYAEIQSRSGRMVGGLRRAFQADANMADVHPVMLRVQNNFHARQAKVNKLLREAGRKFGGPMSAGLRTSLIKAAWDDWAAGRPSVGAVVEARQFVDGFMAGRFSGSDGSLNSYAFFREAASVEVINDSLRRVELPEEMAFDLKAGFAAAQKSGRAPFVEVMEQVKSWDVQDPIDFMSRLYGAVEKVALDAAVVQHLTKDMVRQRLAWHPTSGGLPPKGYVPVHFSKKSRYGKMIDPDVLWHPEIAREIGILDKVSDMSYLPTGALGQFVRDVYDPALGAWKYAITQLRLGHHLRNMLGDWSLTFVAEGMRYGRKSHRDTWSVMSRLRPYDDISIAKALEATGKNRIPGADDVLFSANGHSLTVGQAADAVQEQGLINSYAQLEDIVEVGNDTRYKRALDVLTLRNTAIERGIGTFSEGYQHYGRIQHFLQYIYKEMKDGRFKGDWAALYAKAAQRSRRHHPDATMLAGFERDIMRRIIPFYTWMRFALPSVVEGAVIHPGRTVVFPKASYNLAVAMGLNPDTLADPFPDDQLFPSFLTEQTFGPQFEIDNRYYGINPGFASTDIANMLIADPVHGIGGSISPILRIGPELVTGGSMSTGQQIKDTSDYLDSSIPGLNYLSNITGTSATGSAVSLLTTGKLDPQAQVAAGNKTQSDQMLSALNWALGMNVQNMSRPNYINFAEIEKRNREGGPSAQF